MTHIPEYGAQPCPCTSSSLNYPGASVSGAFQPVLCVIDVQYAAARHERLVVASANAPHGYKRKTARLLYIAAHEHLAAELGAGL